jgi:hypothetical protein
MTASIKTNSGHMGSDWLLDKLEDPFEMFALQSVEERMRAVRSATDEQLTDHLGWDSPPRRYWDVESEHLHEMIGHLLGASFVLAQAALTQTVSIILRLHDLNAPVASFPRSRQAILQFEAPIDPNTSLSKLVIIDTAANYFKHHYEWPADWTNTTHFESRQKAGQLKTIQNALIIGMQLGDHTANLDRALSLASREDQDRGLTSVIQKWRRRLARKLHRQLEISGPESPQS